MRGATLRKLFLKVFFERYTKLSELVSSKCPMHSFKKKSCMGKRATENTEWTQRFFYNKG